MKFYFYDTTCKKKKKWEKEIKEQKFFSCKFCSFKRILVFYVKKYKFDIWF